MTSRELMELAIRAMENSYSPYSDFRVGAALLCADGQVYTGCNIENAAFSTTVCAERCAIFKAVSQGQRAFRAIAVVGGKAGQTPGRAAPCGVCRQVMGEFCDGDFKIYLLNTAGGIDEYTLDDLLPERFGGESMG